VNHSEHVRLIRDGVAESRGRWADLGAGDGTFTLALADVLGAGSQITAVDRDEDSLRRLADWLRRAFPAVAVETLTADFGRPLPLQGLDGVLAANSLHFVPEKLPVLQRLQEMLKPGGRLIVVEYDSDQRNCWVPHPFSYGRWEDMAQRAGFVRTRRLHSRSSRFMGSTYSAVSERPLAAGEANSAL